MTSSDYELGLVALMIISGIDSRLRVGATVHHRLHGNGTVFEISQKGMIGVVHK